MLLGSSNTDAVLLNDELKVVSSDTGSIVIEKVPPLRDKVSYEKKVPTPKASCPSCNVVAPVAP